MSTRHTRQHKHTVIREERIPAELRTHHKHLDAFVRIQCFGGCPHSSRRVYEFCNAETDFVSFLGRDSIKNVRNRRSHLYHYHTLCLASLLLLVFPKVSYEARKSVAL